jgi:hypothetical protein
MNNFLQNALALRFLFRYHDVSQYRSTTRRKRMEVLEKPQSAVAEYSPFYAQLTELEASNAALAFDYESKKGNKEARSHVFKLRQTKGALEAVRKQVKADILVKGRAIDSEAKEIEARIEAMITVHQQKLDEIEQREKDRIAGIQARIADINKVIDSRASDDLRERIAYVESFAIDDSFAEFVAEAAKAKDAMLAKYREMLACSVKAEAEAAELARLRAEAEERAKKERDEAIARAAVERAQAEAARKAEEERAAAARAIAEAEARAKAEREAAERRELELKLAAEAAERRRVEAEQRAEQERKDAAARAEREAAEAVQREKDRVAAIAAAEAAEQAKREANKAHKARINRAALTALVKGGLSEDYAKQCITLIASGKVPAVSIAY